MFAAALNAHGQARQRARIAGITVSWSSATMV
jgi:hypothetical protein